MRYQVLGAVGLAAGVASASARVADAQTMRTISSVRRVGGEQMLRVTLEFGGGKVTLMPGPTGELYQMQLHYDSDHYTPVQQYDPRTGILHLGIEPIGNAGVRVSSRDQLAQTAQFSISPDVPLALTANFGASEATVDLGGATLASLDVNGSATHSVVDFSTPTRGSCASATFTVGASQLEVRHLAQAGCAAIRVDGGIGGASLSFDGAWRRDASLEVDLAVGSLTLKIPTGTGVRLSADRFLTTFDTKGFIKSGDTWTTPDYATAPRKLTVEMKTSMVGVNVEWIQQ